MHGQLIIMTLPQVNHIPHVYQWIFHVSPLVQRRVKLHTMQYDGHIRALHAYAIALPPYPHVPL